MYQKSTSFNYYFSVHQIECRKYYIVCTCILAWLEICEYIYFVSYFFYIILYYKILSVKFSRVVLAHYFIQSIISGNLIQIQVVNFQFPFCDIKKKLRKRSAVCKSVADAKIGETTHKAPGKYLLYLKIMLYCLPSL